MCHFVCQQLFSKNFFVLFPLFQRRLLKLNCVFCFRCCRVQQPRIIYPVCRKKSTLFFNFFPKRHFNQNAQFISLFLCILHNSLLCNSIIKEDAVLSQHPLVILSYLLNNSIPALTLAIVSSFPIISIISVAPAGVICFPETAVLIGQSA